MLYYAITTGHEDRSSVILKHEKKFTNKEFAQMYNEAVEELGGRLLYDRASVAKKMIKLHGFKEVLPTFEILAIDEVHKPIDLEKVSENDDYYTIRE